MAFSLNLHPLPEFDPDIEVGASLSTRWRQWLRDFDTYILASGIRDLGRKRAILLHQAGSRVREIFSQIPDTGAAADYELARDKLTAYFEPQTNRRRDEMSEFQAKEIESKEDMQQYTHRFTASNKADEKLSTLLDKYRDVFKGLGKLRDTEVQLNINQEVIPKAQPPRRIPFHIRQKVQDAVKELQRQDIIEPVPENQPTPWVSPIVAVPKKDGSVRICVDMRMANQAIDRVRYPIPTGNDISLELNGSKYFTKLDLSQAYHQLPLAEESRYITTFSTHCGLYRYKRLAYGINASAEIFQHSLQQNLQGIKGVQNIADDIIIFGVNKEEHDIALEKCLRRLQEKGFTLNANKCKFLQPTLDFFGQIFSEKGTRPDPKRIQDLQNASIPKNASEVRSLLGMANYSSKYIPNYSTITAPLRDLIKKNSIFSWKKEHHNAFEQRQRTPETSRRYCSGAWESVDLSYRAIKEELSIGAQNIILRGSRIVIPLSLRQKAIDIAHESHQGLSKTKAMIREKVWFPKIDDLVKATIDSCLACQATGKENRPEPLQLSELPTKPWEKLHIDYYGPLPTGDYLVVIIDRYSRFPEVEVVSSTKASTLIPKLDRIFAVHGIPDKIQTDNGPPFNGDEFKRYLHILGIKHDRSTPKWPQANGEVERFNQPLGKVIQAAIVEGKPWKQELQRFLLQYRTTPHSTTKVPPCELLFNRQIRGKFPILKRKSIINKHKIARENEEKSQKYQKMYIDKKRHAKESDIAIGDTVLVKQQYKNKFSSRFDKAPYKVIQRKGTMITAENKTRRITRNVSHFKKFPARVDQHEEFDSDIEQELNKEGNQAEREHRLGNNARRQSTRVRSQPVRYGDPIPSRFIR
eukprot:gene5121-biopygen179